MVISNLDPAADPNEKPGTPVNDQKSIEGLWTGSTLFVAAVNKFLGSLNLIEALAQIGNPGNKGITANKIRLGQSVINRTMDMASSLACYAAIKEDHILAAKVSLSPAMIARSWDPVISATARSIYDLATKIIASAQPEAEQCGVTAEHNQLLLNSIVAFSAAIGSETATQGIEPASLDAEFRRAEEVLHAGISPLMTAFKSQSELFFGNCRRASQLAESLQGMLLKS